MPENIIKVHDVCFAETAADAGLRQNGVER